MSSEPKKAKLESGSVTVTGEIDIGHDRTLIILARHGESVSNVSGERADPMSTHLSERGRHQAQALGKCLGDVDFTRVCTNNNPIALETAQIVIGHSKKSKHFKAIQLNTAGGIMEREFEMFAGQSYLTGKEVWGNGTDSDSSRSKSIVRPAVPGRESVRVQEILELFEELDGCESPQAVLAVADDNFIRVLMTRVNTTEKYEVKNWVPELETKGLENCGYHVIEISKHVCDNETKYSWDFIKTHHIEHLKSVGFTNHGGAGDNF